MWLNKIDSYLKELFFLSGQPVLNKSTKGNLGVEDSSFVADVPNDADDKNSFRSRISSLNLVRPWPVVREVFGAYKLKLFKLFLFKLVLLAIVITIPLQLTDLLTKLDNESGDWVLVLQSGLVLLFAIVARSFLDAHAFFFNRKLMMILRRTFVRSLLDKVMMAGGKALDDRDGGRVQNIINNDTASVASLPNLFLGLLGTLVQIAALVLILYFQVGVISLVGAGCLIIIMAAQLFLMQYLNRMLVGVNEFKDKRISKISELIKNFRIVRMTNYTKGFVNIITQIREKEVDKLFLCNMAYLGGQVLMHTTPLLLSVVIFSFYLSDDQEITVALVFSVIAIIAMMRAPMSEISSILYGFGEGVVALNRICNFYNLKDSMRNLTDKTLAPGEVCVKGVSLANKDNIVLRDINLNVKPGELVGICGVTGSGKTALLNSIAGYDMNVSGSITRNGDVTYVPHHAWLVNDTLVNNIRFGGCLDEEYLRDVIGRCHLDSVIRDLPSGEETVVGELGVLLSGGQKQRVSLARALYSRSDILLLDNPLSSLDPEIAWSVFNRVIRSDNSQSRIVVTNDIKLAKLCDRAYLLDDGSLVKLDVSNESKEDPNFGRNVSSDVREDREPGGLEEEFIDRGKYSWPLIKEVVNQSGHWVFLLLMVFSMAAFEGLRIGSEIWIASTSTAPNINLDDILAGYWLLGVGAVAFVFIVQLLLFTRILNHTKRSHKKMLEKVSHAPMSFFDSVPLGRVINRFSVDLDVCSGELLANSSTALMLFMAILTQVAFVSWEMPYFLLGVAIIAVSYWGMQKKYRHCVKELRRVQSVLRSPLYSTVSEAIRNAQFLRLNNNESHAINQVMLQLDKTLQVAYTYAIVHGWLMLRQGLLSSAIVASVVVMVVVSGGGVIASLAITYSVLSSNLISQLLNQIILVEADMNSAQRVAEYCFLEDEGQDARNSGEVDFRELEPKSYQIDFKDVSFKYSGSNKHVVENLSFSVGCGEKVGICGSSGEGKSTILNLILGMYPRNSGSISIGGVDILALGPEKLRGYLSVITQVPLILSGSIRDNVDPLNKHSDFEVNYSLKKVGLYDRIVSSLHLGIHENIHEAGLSAGEIQLLMLGRTILEDRPIVLFDEASSDMDSCLMDEFAKVFFKEDSDKTCICISHHLKPLLHMDRIIVLEGGKISEIGAPQELYEDKSTKFYRIFGKAHVA